LGLPAHSTEMSPHGDAVVIGVTKNSAAGCGKLRSDPVSRDQLFGIASLSAGSLVKIMTPEK
jgi:hypothetical protein